MQSKAQGQFSILSDNKSKQDEEQTTAETQWSVQTVDKHTRTSYVDKVSYTYDSLGQLTRENNVDLNQTIVYTYDNGGNIKSKKIQTLRGEFR